MRISFSAFKQAHPMVSFPGGLINMDNLIIPRQRRKDKVVVVIGPTGSGKSRLSIDLATRFNAEIINSDKIQVYKGLDIVTNKVTDEERRGIPHHLLGIVDPEEDFTADDFVYQASLAADTIVQRDRLPIIAGGSNSFIKALVSDSIQFRSKYECCFLWVDVSMPVLHSFVSKRVDQMLDTGLLEEAMDFFEPSGDYRKGIRRAIGVPEMHDFFKNEAISDCDKRAKLLVGAIDEIKENTCKLACRQLQKILRLGEQLEWRMHHLDATESFLKNGAEASDAWESLVAGPGAKIVGRFLCKDHLDYVSSVNPPSSMSSRKSIATAILGPSSATAVVAATR